MSTPSSDPTSDDATCCGCLHFSIFAKVRRSANKQPSIPQTGSSTVSLLRSADQVTEDGHDSLSREADDGLGGIAIISTLPSQEVSPPACCDEEGTQGREVGEVNPVPLVSTDVPKDQPSITMFQGSSNFQISNTNITAVGNNATIIRFGDGEFTEVQRGLICDYIATLSMLPGIDDNLKKHFLIQLIRNLPRAEAVFNDYQTKKKSGPCFEGTRVELLREMANWVTGTDESRMYVLSGLAGIGKSTVAYTIASRAADLNLLGASFFFSRDEADRNNAKKLFTTIAYQLCVYDEQFSNAIGDALQSERGSAAATKSPQEQLRLLILDPLRSIVQSRSRPVLVVVDALDECCEEDVCAVIQGLCQLVRDLPPFKVILTTRPHLDIDYFLANQDGHKLLHLQGIEDKIVDGDIRLYLKYNLSLEKVSERYPRRQWCASNEEIDALVHAAGRLFIIASTSVRYILDKSASNPAAQMRKLLLASAQDHTPFKDLNQFYTIILRNAVPEGCDDDDIVTRYQSVVGAIVLVQHPLSVISLAHLINIDTEEIRAVLDHLQSVVLLGDDDIPRVYHKSFPDYLMDKSRCKDSHLRIDPNIRHTHIATCCFWITNKYLKYNILSLGTPARFMNNEDGLKKDGITDEQLEEKIPQQLRYACVYWVAHLRAAKFEDSELISRFGKFVNEHALHWFEALSLIGKLDVAQRAIRVVLKLLKSSPDLHRLLSDALRFISMFYELISESALHGYYSALPFCPTESLLYRQYIQEAKHGICDVEGGPEQWDALISDLKPWYQATVVKFSLDSTLFVSYSEQYPEGNLKLKLWDATTGTPISTISGHRFAVSNDFATIASSEDHVITYYNQDGSTMGMMVTASSHIEKLAISSESNRIAASLADGTVCLWKSTNGELIDSFDGDRGDYWLRLEFSCFGTRLLVSSANGVKLRDGISGIFVADLCGSAYNLQLEFSANGSRIASLSQDLGLKLWNSQDGELVGAVTGRFRGYVYYLAISENGSLLVTADDGNVTLWSENCGQLTGINLIKISKYKSAPSIAFSSDNLLAICDDSDIKIYNIETRTMSTLLSRPFVREPVFSPDSTRLVCGGYLCDVRVINTSGSPSRATTSRVEDMALSRDGSRLACGFIDGTLELWRTSPAMQRIASDHSHGDAIRAMEFGPDGRLFASGSENGIVKLWNGGDGSLHGTLEHGSEMVWALTFSHNVLIAGGRGKVTLWDLDTLSLIHTLDISNKTAFKAAISDDGDLAAVALTDNNVNVYDLTNHTFTHIATFVVRHHGRESLTFLPDKSHVVAQSTRDEFKSLNLVNQRTTNEHMLEHLIQLPNTPLWHGIPVLVYQPNRSNGVLFSPSHQTQSRVPLLRVPTDIWVESWALGASMIALGSEDGRTILLRLHTSHVS